MLVAVISVAVVVFIVTLVRIYEICILRRGRRRETRALTEGPSVAGPAPPPLRGLDPVVVASLPLFAYKKTNSSSMECAICLSLLEDQEMARVLPKCRPTFHEECIDKGLGTRSTCPVCRTEADPRVPRSMSRPDHHDHVMIVSQLNPRVASEGCNKEAGESSSRLSSFRRILSLNRSSSSTGIVQAEVESVLSEDLDRQTVPADVSDIYALYA